MVDTTSPTLNDGAKRIADLIAGSEGSGWAFEPSTLAEKPVPPRRWLLDRWIPDGYVSLLSGDGGTGKSLLAMQLATCAAAGMPFLGIEMAPRRVLYLACEDDRDELHRRQADINATLGIDWPDLAGCLFWKSAFGDETTLAGPDKSGRKIVTTALYANLRRTCQDKGIQLVIVDTLADTFGGLEIDRQQVTRFVRHLQAIARENDGAVVLIGHPSVSGIRDGTGISGTTAWRNAVRSVIHLRRPTEEENFGPRSADLRVLERLKGNYAPTDGALTVRYVGGAFVLDGNPEVQHSGADIFHIEIKVASALKEALKSGQEPNPSRNSDAYAPKMVRMYRDVQGLTIAQIEAAIKRMLERHQLRIAHVGPSSRQRKVLVPCDWPTLPDERDPATGAPREGQA